MASNHNNNNNNNNNNTVDMSESSMTEGADRFEDASESAGLTTESMLGEHQHHHGGLSATSSADDALPSGGKSSKGKSRRLSQRVAHSIKKQWKSSDKDKHSTTSHTNTNKTTRSLSPSRSNNHHEEHPNHNHDSESESEETEVTTDDKDKSSKKKHKSKFKPVAKAAASAAKKIAGKKSSSKRAEAETTYEQLQYALSMTGSADSSLATAPSGDLLIHAGGGGGGGGGGGTGGTTMVTGKTPMNTPVGTVNLVDGTKIEQLAHTLPPTLTEEDEDYDEDEERGGDTFDTEQSMEFSVLKPLSSSTITTTGSGGGESIEPTTTTTTTTPSEDDMLAMAEAMALAVEKNPTKSHDEIRRMVLAQPEFQHLTLPDTQAGSYSSAASKGGGSSSSSSKKGFKKTFGSFQSKFTSGAGTAQKKLLEYANGIDSTLGSSVTSFGGFMGSSSTAGTTSSSGTGDRDVTASKPGSVEGGSSETTTAHPAIGDVPPNEGAPVIPQDSVASLEVSTDASSAASLASTAQTSGTEALNRGSLVANTTSTKGELPIKLTAVLWKRRSGFGVLRSSPWERRSFVLQGNSLSYYRAKGDAAGANNMDDATEKLDDHRGADGNSDATAAASHKSHSTKQRVYDGLWQASTSLGLSAAPVPATNEKHSEGSSARGSMDLVKENATICATWGHSGAPSPFCLSIKVKGETKWKLCFASHRSQLQWLAAMTDTVVQASVDNYNIKLLTNADPANQDPVTAAFQSNVSEPPPVSEKSLGLAVVQPADADQLLPQPSLHVSGRRLWIMEPYVIKSASGFGVGPEADEDVSESSYESEEEENDDSETAGASSLSTAAADDDKIEWSLPESKLVFAGIIVNIAILYCRNSSISVQVFWTVVTVLNMALFSFLEAGSRIRAQSSEATTAGARFLVKGQRKAKRRKAKQKGSHGAGGSGSGADKNVGGGARKVKKEKFLPTAGTSALQIKDLSEPCTNANGDSFTRWRAIEGNQLQVRSHGYKSTNNKIGSPGSLYELSQMDVFESPARYPDMVARVRLPKLSYKIDADENKTWKAPDHFVVSLALPTDPPKLGSNTSDGGGYTVTMYFTLRKSTRDVLKRITAEGYDANSEEKPDDIQTYQVNAIRLFEEWCRRAPNDKAFLTRFKMVPLVVNAKEIGLPSWIGKYNGKPLLIKRPGQTGFFLPHPELSCIEFDISLHVFPYLAKQGICYLKDTLFKNLIASVGFVIEGRDDDELPEVVIGLGQVVCPDPAIMIQGADFFAGTAPRSFDPAATEESTPPPTTSQAPIPAALAGSEKPAPPMAAAAT